MRTTESGRIRRRYSPLSRRRSTTGSSSCSGGSTADDFAGVHALEPDARADLDAANFAESRPGRGTHRRRTSRGRRSGTDRRPPATGPSGRSGPAEPPGSATRNATRDVLLSERETDWDETPLIISLAPPLVLYHGRVAPRLPTAAPEKFCAFAIFIFASLPSLSFMIAEVLSRSVLFPAPVTLSLARRRLPHGVLNQFQAAVSELRGNGAHPRPRAWSAARSTAPSANTALSWRSREEEDDEDRRRPAPKKAKKAAAGQGRHSQRPRRVKKKPALRRRDEDEDEEDEQPKKKKKSGTSTT